MTDFPETESSLAREISTAALHEIQARLPEGTLISTPDALLEHGHDETEDLSFLPELVARPMSVEQVSELLEWAHRHRIPVTPQGARTGLSGGALPVHGGLALSLAGLDRIRRIDAADGVAEVEAGVVTARLQEEVAAVGLYYPPDPASRESCLLGGNLAEDSAGPHSCKYGTTRRYVLGLEAVAADGRVFRTGSSNRKDVTGYNLTQLLVGSEGTLAVLTAATLRLVRQPGARLALGFGFDSLEQGADAVVRLFESGVEPAACELMEARALELVRSMIDLPPELSRARAFLLVELDGLSEAQVLAEAERLAGVFPTVDPLVARDARERRRLWDIRARIGEAVKAHSPYKEVDAVVPRSRLADLVQAARQSAAAAGLECVCYGHAGDGNLHVNLQRGTMDQEHWEECRDRAETELVDAVLALGGTVSGEHGIGWTQRRHLDRALDAASLDLMRDLKRALDPRGILNPGKIFPRA